MILCGGMPELADARFRVEFGAGRRMGVEIAGVLRPA